MMSHVDVIMFISYSSLQIYGSKFWGKVVIKGMYKAKSSQESVKAQLSKFLLWQLILVY